MITKLRVKTIATGLAASLLLSACATNGGRDSNGQPQTTFERSIGSCLVTVGAGLLIDMLTNKRRVGVGTAVGVAACAVILVLNNEEDKRRVHESQVAALNAGQDRTDQYVGHDGDARLIKTSVQSTNMPSTPPAQQLPNGDQFVGPCRHTQTTITVQGQGTAALDPDLVCRTAQGNWVSWSSGASI
jgi:hypothetical protein